jgi:hypothetical protein
VKQKVEISGLWIRKLNEKIEVLIEIDNEWRIVSDETLYSLNDNQHSHIFETAFLKKAPKDWLEINPHVREKP